MQKLFLDFESFWDDECSLKKMTPPEYVNHPKFEVLNCAFKYPGRPAFVVDQPELPGFLAGIDWANTWAISHNALFDMMLLALHYRVTAGRYGCTLSMARNWISHSTGSVALKAVAAYYGLPAKWDTLSRTKGVNFHALKNDPVLYEETREYAIDDTGKCEFIFDRIMADGFPEHELDIIDIVVRMAACPQFELDMNLVAEHHSEVLAHKQQLLDNAGMDNRDNLMRDEALAAILTFLNVDVPRKVSKKTGKEQWAFAKTDKEFTDLLEHDDPDVQALVAARLGHKSTLEETRSARFLAIGRVTDKFPIPLKYSGAHTHRFSGDWSINAQNLAQGGKLRHSLKAPKGKKVISIDASQIEARINAELSGETALTEAFREGRDVYCEFGGKVYHRVVTKADKVERLVGKTGILQLGYGSSALPFQNMVRVKGGVTIDLGQASFVVEVYRNEYKKIVDNWGYARGYVLPAIEGTYNMLGDAMWGPVGVEKGRLILPNGNCLRYRDLARVWDDETRRMSYVYYRGTRPHYIYGAKLVENVTQALAFVHIMEVAQRVSDMTERLLMPAHQVHDELIYIVDEHLAEMTGQLVASEMSKSPSWMPNVPLAAEYGIGDSYGDTK